MIRDKIAYILVTFILRYIASDWYENNLSLYISAGMISAVQFSDAEPEIKDKAWVMTDDMRRAAIRLCLSETEFVCWEDGTIEGPVSRHVP